MNRLLSLKLLSEHPKKISTTTTAAARTFHYLSNSTTSNAHVLNSPVTARSYCPYTLLSPSHHCNVVRRRLYGFLLNPSTVEHLISSAKLSKNGLFQSKVQISRTQLLKRSFDLNSSYGHHWRSWSRRLTNDGVVFGLIIANAAVFILWRIADRTFMQKNFTISVENFKCGRLHTLITSAFSHIDMGHIASNMIGLYFFGSSIARVFGPGYLLKLYFLGAITGSVFYLAHHTFIAQLSKERPIWSNDPSKVPGLGASGAVNAIMLLDIFLFPKSTLLFEFFIPVPAILLGVFIIGQDVLRIIEDDPQVSGSAHLGGAVVAVVAWLRLKRKIRF